MILGIDIGNSTVKLGFIERLDSIDVFKLSTNRQKTTDEWFLDIKNLISLASKSVEDVIIMSVVPEVEGKTSQAVEKIFLKKPIIVGKDILSPLKINYKQGKPGIDRQVNSFAAKQLYGYPIIVISLGTALTIDVVNSEGEFDGGIILPGISTSLKALSTQTSLLPIVPLDVKPPLVGKSTEECIQAGIVWGYASLIESYIKKVENFYGYEFKCVLTGGDANLLSNFLDKKCKVEEYLSIKGLYLLYKQHL